MFSTTNTKTLFEKTSARNTYCVYASSGIASLSFWSLRIALQWSEWNVRLVLFRAKQSTCAQLTTLQLCFPAGIDIYVLCVGAASCWASGLFAVSRPQSGVSTFWRSPEHAMSTLPRRTSRTVQRCVLFFVSETRLHALFSFLRPGVRLRELCICVTENHCARCALEHFLCIRGGAAGRAQNKCFEYVLCIGKTGRKGREWVKRRVLFEYRENWRCGEEYVSSLFLKILVIRYSTIPKIINSCCLGVLPKYSKIRLEKYTSLRCPANWGRPGLPGRRFGEEAQVAPRRGRSTTLEMTFRKRCALSQRRRRTCR